MSQLEDLQAFENDAGHYLAQLDRALMQLNHVLIGESGTGFYFEVQGVSQGIKKLGRQMTEYVQEKRKEIFDEIDKESGRTEASHASTVQRKGDAANTERVRSGAEPISSPRL